MSKKIDYLIIGQGLAGSAIAWELLQRGKSIVVVDERTKNRASAYAAGLFNPIIGKSLTKAWEADLIFPFLSEFYSRAEEKLNKKFLHLTSIYRPFISEAEMQQWKKKSESEILKKFLLAFHGPLPMNDVIKNPFGGIEITQSGYLDVATWMSAIRESLIEHEAYLEEMFQEDELNFDKDRVHYRDLNAGKIVYCNGVAALRSKWFEWLPIKPLKGETIEVLIQATAGHIYNRGVYLVPTVETDKFKVGATYQHTPFTDGPSAEGLTELTSKLKALVKIPYRIIHQDWGIRPTTHDRRPMLGHHPGNKNVIIFNGLGTKGVSLAPYFACHLVDWLEGEGDLSPEVNIYRFKALYSRLQ